MKTEALIIHFTKLKEFQAILQQVENQERLKEHSTPFIYEISKS